MLGGARAQVFLSHSSADSDLAREVASVLAEAGVESLFLDVEPERGIRPGREWTKELYVALARCQVLVALDTAKWRASHWCFAEAALARARGKTVIALHLGADTDAAEVSSSGLLADVQHVHGERVDAACLQPLLDEIIRAGAVYGPEFRWDPSRPPYPGLAVLDTADAAMFFGRRRETQLVLDLIHQSALYRQTSLVLLAGPSGCGKSSLLRAGILPQLAGGSAWTVHPPMVPHVDAHSGQLPLVQVDAHSGQLPLVQNAPDGGEGALHLLAFDQIEEALSSSDEDAGYLGLLQQVLRTGPGGVVAVGTIRADALVEFDQRFRDDAAVISRHLVGPLSTADYREIITRPAEVAGCSVDPALVDRLLDEVSAEQPDGSVSADALPLMATVLRRLWDRREGNQITLASYLDLGGLGGAVADTAESVLAVAGGDADELRTALLAMVDVDRDGRLSRRSLPLADVPPQTVGLLQRLVDARLLVRDAGPSVTVRLAHESLVRTWPRLGTWVDEHRTELAQASRFEDAIRRWREDATSTLQGLGLEEAQALQHAGHPLTRSAEAQALLEASLAQRDSVVRGQVEREQSARVSESLRLASESLECRFTEAETALKVAWEALLLDRNEITESAFRTVLDLCPAPSTMVRPAHEGSGAAAVGFFGDGSGIWAVEQRPDQFQTWDADGSLAGSLPLDGSGGERVAAAALPGAGRAVVVAGRAVHLVSPGAEVVATLDLGPASGKERGFSDDVLVAVNANGRCVVCRGALGYLLNVVDGRGLALRATFRAQDLDEAMQDRAHVDRVLRCSVSPGGQHVLTQSPDSTILWDADGFVALLRAPEGFFIDGRFLGNGTIVTTTSAGRGDLWTSDLTPAPFLTQAGADVWIHADHPASEVFVTSVSYQGGAQVWSYAGELRATLDAGDSNLRSAAFSPEGAVLAIGSSDRTVRIWAWPDQRLDASLPGYEDQVVALEFSPTAAGSLLAASLGGDVRVAHLGRPPLPRFLGHSRAPVEIWVSPSRVVSTDRARETYLWSPDGRKVRVAGACVSQVQDGDAAVLATVDEREQFHVWRVWPDRVVETGRSRAVSGGGRARTLLSPRGDRLYVVQDEQVDVFTAAGEDSGHATLAPSPGESDRSSQLAGSCVNPDSGDLLIASAGGRAWVVPSRTGSVRSFLVADHGPDPVRSVSCDPGGRAFFVGLRGEVGVWSWDGEHLGGVPVPGYKVYRLSVSPDGNTLLALADSVGGPSVASLISAGGVTQLDLFAKIYSLWSTRWADDGKRLMIFARHGFQVFSAAGESLARFRAPTRGGVDLWATTPDLRLVAGMGAEGVLRLWDLSEGRRVQNAPVGEVLCLAFTADGERLLLGRPDGSITQYALDVQALFPAAAYRVGQGITVEERERFGLRNPPLIASVSLRSGTVQDAPDRTGFA